MTFCQANASGKGFTTLSVLSAHADESLRIKGLLSESQASLIPLRIVTSGKEKKKIYIYLSASSFCAWDLSHKHAYRKPNYRPAEIKRSVATVVLSLPSFNSVMLQITLLKRQGFFKQTELPLQATLLSTFLVYHAKVRATFLLSYCSAWIIDTSFF